MFGFSYKTPYHSPTPTVEVVKEPKKDESACYTIGILDNGNTQLTLGHERSSKVTMTMNNNAVVQMIRLLAVSLINNYTITVTPIVQDNESEETTGEVE